jgi:AbrB family looped-hinge helix DNA binding protein
VATRITDGYVAKHTLVSASAAKVKKDVKRQSSCFTLMLYIPDHNRHNEIMKQTAKLSSKNQLTIPAWARRKLGLAAGSRVALRTEGDRLILEKVNTGLATLRGALRSIYGDPDQYVRRLRDEWGRRDPR